MDTQKMMRARARAIVMLALECTAVGPPGDAWRAEANTFTAGGNMADGTVERCDGVLLGLSLGQVHPEDGRVLAATLRYIASEAAYWASKMPTIVVRPGKFDELEAKADLVAAEYRLWARGSVRGTRAFPR